MDSKMQPGRFTLRFNANDPQQQMAVDILNRLGRQKAQFLARAIVHYMECQEALHTAVPATVDEQTLEKAILAVLRKHPQFTQAGNEGRTEIEGRDTPVSAVAESATQVWDEFMDEESLQAINKTLAAFRSQ